MVEALWLLVLLCVHCSNKRYESDSSSSKQASVDPDFTSGLSAAGARLQKVMRRRFKMVDGVECFEVHNGEWVRSDSAPVGPYKTCKGPGSIERHWVWNCPRLDSRDLAVRPVDATSMLQRLDRFRQVVSQLTPTHVASQDVIDWPAVVDAWHILGETDPTECPAACLVSTCKPSTRRTYTSHLRRFAQFGGTVQPNNMQAPAEKVLLSMFAQGQKAAAARACISALKAVATLGWIPPAPWNRLWRLAKAAVDSPEQRQFGGPNVLQLMAELCTRVGEWKIYEVAMMSFATVGEIPSLRRSNISKVGTAFQGIKRDHRQITRRLGLYAMAWASWLRWIAPV